MSLKKCIGLVSVAIVGGAIAIGCSSTSSTTTDTDAGPGVVDSGPKKDSAPVDTTDSSTPSGDGGACQPQAVTGYTPVSYGTPAQVNVCSQAEITQIANDCSADLTAAACLATLAGTSPTKISAACLACAVTPTTAKPGAGPIVKLADGTYDINNGGCIDLISGVPGCGDGYLGLTGCEFQACSDASCGTDPNVDPFKSCRFATEATGGVCKTYVYSAACQKGLQKPAVGTTCFGQALPLFTNLVKTTCGTTPTAPTDAGPG